MNLKIRLVKNELEVFGNYISHILILVFYKKLNCFHLKFQFELPVYLLESGLLRTCIAKIHNTMRIIIVSKNTDLVTISN
jgi:hypothetical protein